MGGGLHRGDIDLCHTLGLTLEELAVRCKDPIGQTVNRTIDSRMELDTIHRLKLGFKRTGVTGQEVT